MSSTISRILVFGHSVSLAVRPPRQFRGDGTYVDLLRRHLRQATGREAEVFNLAMRSNMIDESDLAFTSNVMRYDPDLVIMHYGINECAPRAIPRWLWMWLHGFSNQSRVKRLLARVASIFEARAMRLLRCGGWLSSTRFLDCMQFKVSCVQKEAACRVMLINIGPATDRYRRMLPGVDRQISRFNSAIAEVAEKCGAELIDLHGLVTSGGIERLQPDGSHLSAEGHRQLFDYIRARL